LPNRVIIFKKKVQYNPQKANSIKTRVVIKKGKGQPGVLKLPHTQSLGRGPTIWCIVRSLTLFLHKRLFPGLEPVTFQSHDNNFTSCAKVTPQDQSRHIQEKSSVQSTKAKFN